MREAATAGVTDFGENYLQEALGKMDQLPVPPAALALHRRPAVEQDPAGRRALRLGPQHRSFSIARRLAEQRPFHAPPLNACIQVALVPEPTKGGVEPENLAELAAQMASLPRLKLRGLMCIPPPQPDAALRAGVFARLRELLESLNARGLALDTLSMGMSADFESAIAEGATM